MTSESSHRLTSVLAAHDSSTLAHLISHHLCKTRPQQNHVMDLLLRMLNPGRCPVQTLPRDMLSMAFGFFTIRYLFTNLTLVSKHFNVTLQSSNMPHWKTSVLTLTRLCYVCVQSDASRKQRDRAITQTVNLHVSHVLSHMKQLVTKHHKLRLKLLSLHSAELEADIHSISKLQCADISLTVDDSAIRELDPEDANANKHMRSYVGTRHETHVIDKLPNLESIESWMVASAPLKWPATLRRLILRNGASMIEPPSTLQHLRLMQIYPEKGHILDMKCMSACKALVTLHLSGLEVRISSIMRLPDTLEELSFCFGQITIIAEAYLDLDECKNFRTITATAGALRCAIHTWDRATSVTILVRYGASIDHVMSRTVPALKCAKLTVFCFCKCMTGQMAHALSAWLEKAYDAGLPPMTVRVGRLILHAEGRRTTVHRAASRGQYLAPFEWKTFAVEYEDVLGYCTATINTERCDCPSLVFDQLRVGTHDVVVDESGAVPAVSDELISNERIPFW